MANTYTADRVSAEKPWRKVTSLIAGAAIVLSMGSPALATNAIADDKPAATRASEGLAEVYVGTPAASSTVAQVGEGTKDSPYVTLEDALAAVKDGGVVKVLSGGLDLGSTYGRTFSFTAIGKNVTIEAAEESATIATSTPIILGANVTFKNIKFNFTAAGNAYIAANGYSLGLENVSHEGDNKVNLFAGSVKNKNIASNGSVSTGGLLYGFAPGNGGNIDISGEGTELGDIYAAGVNSSFEKPVKINVSDVGDGKIDNIYSNGAWSIGETLQNHVNDSCESAGSSDEPGNDAEQTVRTASADKDVDTDITVDSDANKRLTPADELKYYDKLYVNLSSKVAVTNICDKGAALGVVLTVKESTTQPDQTEDSKDGEDESSDSAPEAIEPNGEPTTQPDQVEVPEVVEGESEDEGAQPEGNTPEIVPDAEPEMTPETSESTTPESTPGAETPAAPESPEVETTTPDASGPAVPVVPESPSTPSAPENAGAESESTGGGNTSNGSAGSADASDNASTSSAGNASASGSASGGSTANSTNSNDSSNASSSSSSDRDVSNSSSSSATSSSSASGSSSSAATNGTQVDKGVTVYRLLNPNNSEHLYTTDANEVRVLVDLGWIDEGIGWIAPSAGTGVHRLYNPASGGHLYTKDANEIAVLTKLGWKDEGVNFYSAEDASGKPTQGAQAIYRQFNPNNRTGVGTHNFTKDTNEHKTLVARGWHDENIGWYGLK